MILTESELERAIEDKQILTVEHYNELISTLRAVKAILNQPVFFTDAATNPRLEILLGDCDTARDMIERTLSNARRKGTISLASNPTRQESNTATPLNPKT